MQPTHFSDWTPVSICTCDCDALIAALRVRVSDRVIVLNGKTMRTSTDLFATFESAFHFPGYFGHNWAALDECLADLSWFPSAEYCVVISNGDLVLEDEPPSQRLTLARLMVRISEEWAQGITIGSPWDRSAKKFWWTICANPAIEISEEFKTIIEGTEGTVS